MSSVQGIDPTTGQSLDPPFPEASVSDVERAVQQAEAAFEPYTALPAAKRAAFLRAIGEEIVALGDALLSRAQAETALPAARLTGERGRTVGQLGLFADVVDEGSWVGARIDRAQPDRQPAPRPDLRRMLVPLGPVAVFGASNFPLAFSVAGGDTASALAAGCTVVVKAHPAHPGTSDLVAQAIRRAAARTGMPEGVFGMVQGARTAVGVALVEHPLVKAVGFTGSLRGGRALYDAAARRPEPIPVYAEMGSSNPVFILPRALASRGEAIAKGLVASVTLGVGQFCTNPGLTVVERSDAASAFAAATRELVTKAPVGTVVHSGIQAAYAQGLAARAGVRGVTLAAQASAPASSGAAAPAALLVTDAPTFSREASLREELYGPATLLVECASKAEVLALARTLEGHLTATVHGDGADLTEYAALFDILRRKVGRVVVNGYPTGVEVAHAMHHGGPYPATTDSRSTSVGSAAIERFARPVCYQDVPEALLPEELRGPNPRGVWRLVDGRLTRDPL